MGHTEAPVYASGGTEILQLGVRVAGDVRKIGMSLEKSVRSSNGLGLTISGISSLFDYKYQRFSWSK